ncbi:HK97 gp10 family phage protein [Lysinibacillus telephonicus]|uniref:HK97 gp10 family phage protein n=1 Tax=Lysinibacillus telephonicus TaxID=1714840 RepID=UPI0031FCCDF6
MAKWGKVNFRQLEQLFKRTTKLEKQYEQFLEGLVKEIAARMLRKVIKRTPVGQYEDGTVGGTLRRGWTIDTNVTKKGNVYEITIFNPVEYSQYVEFGHRTRNHQGWVNGRFMMTISADEVEREAPQIIEKKVTNLLKEAFGGN